jgi:carboxyl-terminal processing protease
MKNLVLIILLLAASYTTHAQQKSEVEMGGIGIQLKDMYGMSIVVDSVIANSPAEKAGLRKEDLIDQVNGTDCFMKTIDQVAQLIRGPVGSVVKIRIKRGDEVLEFDIKRESLSSYNKK